MALGSASAAENRIRKRCRLESTRRVLARCCSEQNLYNRKERTMVHVDVVVLSPAQVVEPIKAVVALGLPAIACSCAWFSYSPG